MVCIDDEIPFEIPAGWEWARLGLVFAHNTGKALNGAQKVGTLLRYITTSNLYWDRFELAEVREMYFSDSEIDKCTVVKGDLLVCEGGDIGRAAIWDRDFSICIQNHIHRLRSYCNMCIRFFYYTFLLYKGIGEIGGKGIGIQGLSSGALHNIIIPIPPLSEQGRIVSILDEVIAYVNKYEKSQERLDAFNESIHDRLKKSILQEAIQGRLVPQDSSEESASTLLEHICIEKHKLQKEGKLKKKDIVDSIIFKGEDNKYYEKVGSKVLDISEEIPFEIPGSWEWTRLANIANLYTGNSISETEKRAKYTGVSGMDYIGTKDVGFNSNIEYNNGVSIPSRYLPDFKIAPSGSVLMCIEGGSAGRKIAILEKEVCFGNKLCCFSPYADLSQYLFYYLQSPSFFEIFQKNKTGIIGGVSVNTLKDLLVAIPPINEQVRIVAKIQSLKL